jgi:hypothetical protein
MYESAVRGKLMRFIVRLYRLLIIAILALAIISASFIIFKVSQSSDLTGGTTAYVIIAVLTGAMFIILSIGITAIFISMHDRLETIAGAAAAIADHVADIASQQIERGDAYPLAEPRGSIREEPE